MQRPLLPAGAGGAARAPGGSGAFASTSTSSSSAATDSSSSSPSSRLEPEVTQLLNLVASSFNDLVSPGSTVIGQVEEAERGDDDGDAAMADASSSTPSLQPIPLAPATLPYALLHSRSLTQQTVLHTSAATLIDSCERLLGVVSQLRLHRTLHDRTRYSQQQPHTALLTQKQIEHNQRTRRALITDVSAAIEALELHHHHSAAHSIAAPPLPAG